LGITVIAPIIALVDIICYGENGAGKSFTLFDDKGVIQLTLETIFTLIQTTLRKEYLIRASILEIRNECIRDLYSNKEHLELIETDNGIRIKELTEIVCRDVKTGIELFNKKRRNTDLVYKLIVESKGIEEEAVTMSTINFVELADPSFKDEFDSSRSIGCLNEVIAKVIVGKSADFSKSKLTQYLQESLSGNAKIALICTMSTAYTSYKKTKEALMFGRQLSKLKMTPKKNVTDNLLESFLLQYKEQLSTLDNNSSSTHLNELKSAILTSSKNTLDKTVLQEKTANSLNIQVKNSVEGKTKSEFLCSEEELENTLIMAEKNFFQELIADRKQRLDVTYLKL
jgi:centromeric protein E